MRKVEMINVLPSLPLLPPLLLLLLLLLLVELQLEQELLIVQPQRKRLLER